MLWLLAGWKMEADNKSVADRNLSQGSLPLPASTALCVFCNCMHKRCSQYARVNTVPWCTQSWHILAGDGLSGWNVELRWITFPCFWNNPVKANCELLISTHISNPRCDSKVHLNRYKSCVWSLKGSYRLEVSLEVTCESWDLLHKTSLKASGMLPIIYATLWLIVTVTMCSDVWGLSAHIKPSAQSLFYIRGIIIASRFGTTPWSTRGRNLISVVLAFHQSISKLQM